MKWLKIQGRENNLSNREQGLRLQRWDNSLASREDKLNLGKEQLRLQHLYDNTQSQIRELRLNRTEANILWDKRMLEDKWRKIQDLQYSWRSRSG